MTSSPAPVEAACVALSLDPCEAARSVAMAIRASLSPPEDGLEAVWCERIERLRASLEASTEPLNFIDYGAGAPTLTLSADEMRRGRPVTAPAGELCRRSSKPPGWSRLLFHLVRHLQPERSLELGTCLGLSAAYQAAALVLNGRGSLISIEGGAALAARARLNLTALGLARVRVVTGTFDERLGEVLEVQAPLDYVFLDGHHDEAATLRYFQRCLSPLRPGGVVVLDDVRWSPGMQRAWERIRAHAATGCTVDLGTIGIWVRARGDAVPHHATIDLGSILGRATTAGASTIGP
jgi:predicted O-methyltransferase YrrM